MVYTLMCLHYVLIATCVADVPPACIVAGGFKDQKQK